MTDPQYDLLVSAGRVFDTRIGLDGPGTIATQADRIVATGPFVTGNATETIDFPDGVLLPGLVDMHTHPAPSSWKYGIDPDVEILPRGATTILSQGDSGAAHWPQYRDKIIETSKTRVRLAISPAINGETGCLGEPAFENLTDLDVDACVSAIRGSGNLIWGVSVNASFNCCGSADPREVVRRTLEIAELTDKPILYGNRSEPYDWPISDQLNLLRAGDVLTYCFHQGPNGIVEDDNVIDAAWQARERGVLFDVGHGMASFHFPTVEAALADGFLPDTISTDQYISHVGSMPQHDLPLTMSKMIAAGLTHEDAFERTTTRPADALHMTGEIGTLTTGSSADVTVLQWHDDGAALVDVAGNQRHGGYYEAITTIKSGKVINPQKSP